MPIGDAMRVASKARLVQAMQDSPACRHAPNLKQAAEVFQPCHCPISPFPLWGCLSIDKAQQHLLVA